VRSQHISIFIRLADDDDDERETESEAICTSIKVNGGNQKLNNARLLEAMRKTFKLFFLLHHEQVCE
jgi:hypothetical protein